MTSWRQVVHTHRIHPTWTAPEIAAHLECLPSYVRAVAQRKGLDLPKAGPHKNTTISVPTDQVERIRRDDETPNECLRRIVRKALIREWARAA